MSKKLISISVVLLGLWAGAALAATTDSVDVTVNLLVEEITQLEYSGPNDFGIYPVLNTGNGNMEATVTRGRLIYSTNIIDGTAPEKEITVDGVCTVNGSLGDCTAGTFTVLAVLAGGTGQCVQGTEKGTVSAAADIQATDGVGAADDIITAIAAVFECKADLQYVYNVPMTAGKQDLTWILTYTIGDM